MANGWDGADPVQQDDGATSYELGVAVTVNEDITITGVRVWHGASSGTVAGRAARLWTVGGATLAEADLDDVLAPGWSTYSLDAPLERTAGAQLVLSYSTFRYYGATPGGYPNDSADGAVTYTGGLFRETVTPIIPNTPSSSFYGVDLVYTLGIGGNVAPVVTLAATVEGLQVDVTASVVDESPGSVTYVYDWGDGSTTATSSTSASHTYAAHGIYAVFVVATDAAGAKGVDAVPVVTVDVGDGIDVAAAMAELGARLRTIADLPVYDYPPKKVAQVPAAIVSYPSQIMFDAAGHRALDTMIVGIVVVVARLVDRVAHSELGGFASGTGPRSVKAVLESGEYSAIDALIVQSGEFDVITIGGTEYLAVVLTVDVKG